ncbi:hypothetical protein QJQ45_006900 [Haematococcus lacustris]|nr:hypothetical protein QJQ45_006900 [Haematococcus lacustris]
MPPRKRPSAAVDRDCNAALNMQRNRESKWRPLELCYWPEQGALPAKGKEYPGLGYKRLRDKPPKAQQQQPAEAQRLGPYVGDPSDTTGSHPQGRSKWASDFRHAQAAELNMWGEVDSCGSDTYWESHAQAMVRGGGKPEMQDRHVMLQDFAAQAAVTVTQVDVSASSHTLLCPPLQYQPSYAPLLRLPNLPQQQYSDLPLHTYSHSPTDSGASSSSSSQGRHVASSETSGSQASIGSPSLRSSPGRQPRSLHTSSSSGGGGPSSSPSVLASAWQAAHSSVPSSLTAVFDGHSGSRAARAAAWRLPTLLACNPQLAAASGQSSPMRQMEPDAVGALDSALHSAFACMEHEILEDARSRPPGESDGTTALVGLQVGLHLAVANAGDCRAVLCRGGRALRLTTDHTPDLPRERQRIEACNGMVYQVQGRAGKVRGVWRLVRPIAMGRGAKLCAVSRGLGDLDFKEPVPLISAQPEVTHVTLRPSVDEFVVYGSDGLWAVLEDQEVVAHVADELQQLLGDFRHSGCDVAIQDEVDGDVLASTTDDSRNLPIDTLSHVPHALEQTAGVVPATALHAISRRVAARSREQRSTAASAAAASLVELAKSRGSRDDITAVVTLFDWGCLPRAKQLVVFFGAASIGTRGGWGADAVLRACCKVVCRPRGTDQRRGRVVLVDEHRTSRVSSAVNGQQPCERQLNKRRTTRPADWKPPAGHVEPRLLRPAWSQRRDQAVRGMMWCPVVAPRKPPQAPRSSQAATPAAASEPGPSTPLPAKRSRRTKAEPEAAEPSQPTKGKGKAKGKAAKAKPAPQPGRWLDRDCNAALNMQRIGESKWRPLELCFWPEQGKLPAKGKEYPGLGHKRLRDKPPKAQQQQPAEAQ